MLYILKYKPLLEDEACCLVIGRERVNYMAHVLVNNDNIESVSILKCLKYESNSIKVGGYIFNYCK